MRIVEITKNFENKGIKFKAGRKMVMPEDIEFTLRNVYKDCIGMSLPLETVYKPYQGQDLTNKKLFCWRTGGVGDLAFLSPVLVYLKEKYKGLFLRVASSCKQPLENLPEIDELYDLPFDAALLDGMDFELIFQGILETGSEKSKKTHAVDMFFSYFSIDSTQFPKEKKCPKLVFNAKEMDWLGKKVTEMGILPDEYVIGIQMETSAQLRNYPREKMKAVIDHLAVEPKVKIVLIGGPEHAPLADFYKSGRPNVTAATMFSVRESIVLSNRYDLILAPDSFMIQMAGALKKPLVGLYGPFASELRMAYFNNAIALEPKVPCSPCFVHDAEPCIKGFPSPCFTQVKVEDVLQALDYQKYKFTGSHFGYMRAFISNPDFSEIEQYFLSADKGLCFFSGYFKHFNMISIDTNLFAKPDISDISTEFQREAFPFVLYMENFSQNRIPMYNGSKTLVRPSGYFIVYKSNIPEQFFLDIKKDVGKDFTLIYSKYDSVLRTALIVGKKNF